MFDGTEFGGGLLSRYSDLGCLLFLLALILAVKYSRAAAASALVAGVDSLPLYLYLVFPRPFRRVWPGEWVGEMPRENFVWNGWWATGIVFAVLVAFLCGHTLIRGQSVRS